MERSERDGQVDEQARRDGDAGFPRPDFNGFVTGLYAQTLLAMGAVRDEGGEKKEPDMAEAQFLIDTIAMIEQKTGGNLTGEEDAYLKKVLNDLRMRYVSAARAESGDKS